MSKLSVVVTGLETKPHQILEKLYDALLADLQLVKSTLSNSVPAMHLLSHLPTLPERTHHVSVLFRADECHVKLTFVCGVITFYSSVHVV